MITVECTWGDGPDVLLSIPHDSGGPRRQVDLTARQAEKLAQDLLRAIESVKALESICDAHDKTPADNQTNYTCVCCGKNWVDIDNGYDTCSSCLKNI